jgi:hypothetical protein
MSSRVACLSHSPKTKDAEQDAAMQALRQELDENKVALLAYAIIIHFRSLSTPLRTTDFSELKTTIRINRFEPSALCLLTDLIAHQEVSLELHRDLNVLNTTSVCCPVVIEDSIMYWQDARLDDLEYSSWQHAQALFEIQVCDAC